MITESHRIHVVLGLAFHAWTFLPSSLHWQVQVDNERRVDRTVPDVHDCCINQQRLLAPSNACPVHKHCPLFLYIALYHLNLFNLSNVLLPTLSLELLHRVTLLGNQGILPCHSLCTPSLVNMTKTMYQWLCSSHRLE